MTKKKTHPETEEGTATANPPSEQTPTMDFSGGVNRPPEEGIGERIRIRRDELQLNYEELSRLTAEYDYWGGAGLTPAMLARYEKGKDGKHVLPGARELRLLCDTLDVTADWIIRGVSIGSMGEYAHFSAKAVADLTVKLFDQINAYKMFESPKESWETLERDEKLKQARKR